eukprot:jgi/Botrbrau1/3042/Bobra.0070s0038.1
MGLKLNTKAGIRDIVVRLQQVDNGEGVRLLCMCGDAFRVSPPWITHCLLNYSLHSTVCRINLGKMLKCM